MFTVILADGLTEDVLSPESQHLAQKANVGRHEIDRLLGWGRDYGRGPLPTFLKQAEAARSDGAPIGILLLEDPGSPDEGSDLVEPVRQIEKHAGVVTASKGDVPLEPLCRAVGRLTGSDPLSTREGRDGVRFLLVGCHTDRRILATAILLRNVLGYEDVAVSSHLLGSATAEAHFASLRHTFPAAGIEVFLDLGEAARFAGLDPGPLEPLGCTPCAIEPAEARRALGDEQRRIVELLCLHWTRVDLRPLAGGFSGSLLFLAGGWKGDARTEPMVLKIDSFAQMRREIHGYHQVKDFFGKHVPAFGYPVALGDSMGVAMDLAAMEGRPETLQDTFMAADGEEGFGRFMQRLEKALQLISQKLYRNTCRSSWLSPYRRFELHTDRQLRYLRRNLEYIVGYLNDDDVRVRVDADGVEKMLRLVASNEDGVESEVCQSHGDLNYQNIICDEGDNIWFIDWTHSDRHPIEMDFAKLENDAKVVISKEFDAEDLPRLKQLEEYLLSHRLPAEPNSLPEGLKFAKWDLRFRKVLEAVRKIRQACFSLKQGEDWLVYRVALLKYALHATSFDKRRGRGECDLPGLVCAYFSVEALLFLLVSDDFHLKIRGERPSSYPHRQRVSIDEAPWALDCPAYDPPYHVDPSVLQQDHSRVSGGWADPEDHTQVEQDRRRASANRRDGLARPLNPKGRTGIAGRGLLGRWGPNLAVGAIVTRLHGDTGGLDILLGREDADHGPALPKGFVAPAESPEAAVRRVLGSEAGWQPGPDEGDAVFDGYCYDARQTDHAWVETRAYLFHHDAGEAPTLFRPGSEFEEVSWRPLGPQAVNSVPSSQARLIREAVKRLQETGRIDPDQAAAILTATG